MRVCGCSPSCAPEKQQGRRNGPSVTAVCGWLSAEDWRWGAGTDAAELPGTQLDLTALWELYRVVLCLIGRGHRFSMVCRSHVGKVWFVCVPVYLPVCVCACIVVPPDSRGKVLAECCVSLTGCLPGFNELPVSRVRRPQRRRLTGASLLISKCMWRK